MSAWDQPVGSSGSSNFRWAKWYVWAEGYNTLRLVGEPLVVPTHYLSGRAVKCLGKECPICEDNRRLWAEYGETAKDHGYMRIDNRIFANVIDRSAGKICPKCGHESKNGETACTLKTKDGVCSQLLVTVEEVSHLNVVRVVNLSKTAFEELQKVTFASASSQGYTDPTQYDITFLSVGSGKERRSKPQAVKKFDMEPVEVKPEDLFDLENSGCFTTLTADEMQQVRRGVQIRDIFTARKSNSSAEVLASPISDPDESAAVAARISKLMEEE